MVMFNVVGQSLLKLSAIKSLENRRLSLILLVFGYCLFISVSISSVYLLKFVDVTFLNLIMAMNFIVISVVGFYYFNETLTNLNIFGLILILLGIGFYSL